MVIVVCVCLYECLWLVRCLCSVVLCFVYDMLFMFVRVISYIMSVYVCVIMLLFVLFVCVAVVVS